MCVRLRWLPSDALMLLPGRPIATNHAQKRRFDANGKSGRCKSHYIHRPPESSAAAAVLFTARNSRVASHLFHCLSPVRFGPHAIWHKTTDAKLPGNLNGKPDISGSGWNLWPANANGWKLWWRILERGSRGPSTVTLMAFM